MTDTSKSYAEALFSLALESDTLEETLAALKMLRLNVAEGIVQYLTALVLGDRGRSEQLHCSRRI